MDAGRPISYQALEDHVPVYSSDGEEIGRLHHVVADEEKDIFHGLVISEGLRTRRFVPAEHVRELHENRVDLDIDAGAARALPEPSGGTEVFTEDPAAMGKWSHILRRLTMRKDWQRKE